MTAILFALLCANGNHMLNPHNIIVFTDLDGCFLDHQSYDYAPALPALERLHALKVPVITTTSKTLAELKSLNLPFGNVPQIAENGMVIFDGTNERALFKDYADIITFIQSLPGALRKDFLGFNDMDVDVVIQHTSLSKNNAGLAKERLGSEPFLWSGNDNGMEQLKKLTDDQGLAIIQGGRFYHLMSAKGSKSKAIEMLISDKENITTIALGDGPNDATMLASVDYGIKIPNASGHDFTIDHPKGKIIETAIAGPKGWNLSIQALLDQLRL